MLQLSPEGVPANREKLLTTLDQRLRSLTYSVVFKPSLYNLEVWRLDEVSLERETNSQETGLSRIRGIAPKRC